MKILYSILTALMLTSAASAQSVKVCTGSKSWNINPHTSITTIKKLNLATKKSTLSIAINPKKSCTRKNTLKVNRKINLTSLNELLAQLVSIMNTNTIQPPPVEYTEKHNIVFVRNTFRALLNSSKNHGTTLFSETIRETQTKPWVRLLNDDISQTTVDIRFVNSPDYTSYQINEIVFQRATDDTLLVIHAPENHRGDLVLLLSNGDPFNPQQVIEIRIQDLMDYRYNYLGGSGPIGPIYLTTDKTTGITYLARNIQGLNGAAFVTIEYSTTDSNRIIVKPAINNNYSYEGGTPVQSGVGFAVKSEGIGYLTTTALFQKHPYFSNQIGVTQARDGIIDQLLKNQLNWSTITRSNRYTNGSILPALFY